MPYVFAIYDPRLPEGKDAVYVGSGAYPWESVVRHLEKSSNPEMAAWAEGLHKDFPEGIEILGRVVADRFHGDLIPFPDPRPGITRVQWEILAFDDREEHEPDGNRIIGGTSKTYWLNRLVAEGHPILNRKVGRPNTRTKRNGVPIHVNHVTMEKEHVS